MKYSKIIKFLIIIFLVAGIATFFYFKEKNTNASEKNNNLEKPEILKDVLEKKDKKELIEIEEGSTYGVLMKESGIDVKVVNNIYNASLEKYDLAKIKTGHNIELIFDKDSEELKELIYKIDSEEEIAVKNKKYCEEKSEGWIAEKKLINYEVKVVVKEGEVETSMYESALENDIDERAIINLANAFQWTIDFALDPRKGDKFKFIYEERFLEGEYIMPGKVLAGEYINDGEKYEVYYFEESEDNIGYFDKDGNSVQKMFLKAPVSFKYISSGFTTGLRYIEAFNVSTGHRAIDYAAAYGTPIRTVGDGTVIFVAYNGAYGNMVKIRHNGVYTTNYGHMSKFAVKKGSKVKQGDVIGYVGSTGFSTGPHLHFEMVKNGVKVNPLKEILPPGQPIKEENRDRFSSEMQKFIEIMSSSD